MGDISGFKPIHYCFLNFWNVLVNSSAHSPNTLHLMRLTEATLLCEDVRNDEKWKRLKDLYKRPRGDMMVSLAALELVYSVNVRSGASVNKELEFNGRKFQVFEIYEHLDKIKQELVEIMMEIAKKYSLEIPLQAMGGTGGQIMRIG